MVVPRSELGKRPASLASPNPGLQAHLAAGLWHSIFLPVDSSLRPVPRFFPLLFRNFALMAEDLGRGIVHFLYRLCSPSIQPPRMPGSSAACLTHSSGKLDSVYLVMIYCT